MKEKVLFVATVLRGHILVFHLPYMRWFQEQGYEVHVCAGNDTEESEPEIPYCDRYVALPFERSPLHPKNIAVYRQLKKQMEDEQYALIHCHTPVGGMLGRLCARSSRKHGTQVLYTAHGFHFFSGAPLKNWLLYYPAEWWLAKYTDVLITINREDFERAKAFSAKRVELVAGVGVDLAKFETPTDKGAVREALGIPADACIAICVGEHSLRKNHETALRAVAMQEDCWLLFCGVGETEDSLKTLAETLGITHRVRFLGFRKDVPELLAASDIFLFPSRQEGLPVALMEAMAAGLPCVVSRVRGNADLICQGEGGMLCAPEDADGFAEGIQKIWGDPSLWQTMSDRNLREIKAYGLQEVCGQVTDIYRRQLQGEGER